MDGVAMGRLGERYGVIPRTKEMKEYRSEKNRFK